MCKRSGFWPGQQERIPRCTRELFPGEVSDAGEKGLWVELLVEDSIGKNSASPKLCGSGCLLTGILSV